MKHIVESVFPEKKPINIKVTTSDDLRSYHICSDKIKNFLDFTPQHTVDDAIKDLCKAFKDNKLSNSFDDDKYFNVRTMQKLMPNKKIVIITGGAGFIGSHTVDKFLENNYKVRVIDNLVGGSENLST